MHEHATDVDARLVGLVEVLYPDGAVEHAVADAPAELVVARAASPAAARRLATMLAPDGIGWIAAPPGGRRLARTALAGAGLVSRGSWLVAPTQAPRALLPLQSSSGRTRARLAAEAGLGRRWRLAARCHRLLLTELARSVGLLVQREGSRPPLDWLGEPGAAGVAISAGWHEPSDGLVLHVGTRIVKTSRAGSRRDPAREAALVVTLGAAAAAAGARVPRVLRHGTAGRRVVLVEEALAGARAADMLRARPDRLAAFLADAAEWLARWHEGTRAVRILDGADVEQLLHEPESGVVTGAGAHLGALARSLIGQPVPFAAAHNDLTTWNILVDASGIAVLDWEEASSEALPLVDLDYLVVDAVAAARRLPRDRAFIRCSGSGADGSLARGLREQLQARLGIADDVAELARAACWLGHARNEAARARPGSPRPFAAIVAALAAP